MRHGREMRWDERLCDERDVNVTRWTDVRRDEIRYYVKRENVRWDKTRWDEWDEVGWDEWDEVRWDEKQVVRQHVGWADERMWREVIQSVRVEAEYSGSFAPSKCFRKRTHTKDLISDSKWDRSKVNSSFSPRVSPLVATQTQVPESHPGWPPKPKSQSLTPGGHPNPSPGVSPRVATQTQVPESHPGWLPKPKSQSFTPGGHPNPSPGVSPRVATQTKSQSLTPGGHPNPSPGVSPRVATHTQVPESHPGWPPKPKSQSLTPGGHPNPSPGVSPRVATQTQVPESHPGWPPKPESWSLTPGGHPYPSPRVSPRVATQTQVPESHPGWPPKPESWSLTPGGHPYPSAGVSPRVATQTRVLESHPGWPPRPNPSWGSKERMNNQRNVHLSRLHCIRQIPTEAAKNGWTIKETSHLSRLHCSRQTFVLGSRILPRGRRCRKWSRRGCCSLAPVCGVCLAVAPRPSPVLAAPVHSSQIRCITSCPCSSRLLLPPPSPFSPIHSLLIIFKRPLHYSSASVTR